MSNIGAESDFERLIDISSEDFLTVITSNLFYDGFVSRDSIIIDYIISHFDLILQYGFKTTKCKKHISIICYNILRNITYPLFSRVINETSLITFITNYPIHCKQFSNSSRHMFFLLLPRFIFSSSGQMILPFASTTFFNSIIQVLDYYPAFEFMNGLISRASARTLSTFETINLSSMIISGVFLPVIGHQCEEIICTGFSHGLQYQIANSLLNNRVIIGLINLAFETRSYLTYGFISSIYHYCVINKSIYQMKQIKQAIESFTHDFCVTILENVFFNQVSDRCLQLITDILDENSKMTQEIFQVCKKVFQDFFLFPNHNILHLSFLKLMIVLSKKSLIDQQFLNGLDMHSNILFHYENKESFKNASYWGHLREIIRLIDLYNVSECGVDQYSWTRWVQSEVSIQNSIVDRDYGGYSPTLRCSFGGLDVALSFLLIFLTFFGILWVFRKRIQ